MSSENKILTIPEVADYLRIGRSNAYELAKQPGFPAIRIKKQIRVPFEKLEEWVRTQAMGA